jgi:hypothetical protein
MSSIWKGCIFNGIRAQTFDGICFASSACFLFAASSSAFLCDATTASFPPASVFSASSCAASFAASSSAFLCAVFAFLDTGSVAAGSSSDSITIAHAPADSGTYSLIGPLHCVHPFCFPAASHPS